MLFFLNRLGQLYQKGRGWKVLENGGVIVGNWKEKPPFSTGVFLGVYSSILSL